MAEQELRSAAAAAPKPAPARPLAAVAAGYDYFVSEAHYTSLANRILASLQRGSRIVLVTGDPKPNPLILSAALTRTASRLYEVLAVPAAPEFSRDRLRNGSERPLFVFEDAERLTDAQLAELYDYLISAGCDIAAGVLPAGPELWARLERSKAAIFDEIRVARLNLHELGREEIESFIRRQLPPGEEASALTPEAIDGIADFSGGDPAQVNRLARLMQDFPHWGGSQRETKPADVVAEPPPGVPSRRHHAAWTTSAVVLLCVAAGVVIKTELKEPDEPRVAVETSVPPSPIAPPASIIEAPPVDVASPLPETTPSGEVQQATLEPAKEPVPAEPPAEQRDRPEPGPAETSAPAPVEPRLSAEQVATLVARGDAFIQTRDIASARLFYERAAEAGDGRAALRMGETFDPAFLARAGIRGPQGDRQQAVFWYGRARDLANPDAARLLDTLGAGGQERVSK